MVSARSAVKSPHKKQKLQRSGTKTVAVHRVVAIGAVQELKREKDAEIDRLRHAATASLFARPRHPYTAGLVASIPRIREEKLRERFEQAMKSASQSSPMVLRASSANAPALRKSTSPQTPKPINGVAMLNKILAVVLSPVLYPQYPSAITMPNSIKPRNPTLNHLSVDIISTSQLLPFA